MLANPSTTAQTPILEDVTIATSWDTIRILGETIALALSGARWQIAHKYIQQRRELVANHFEKFPVGPATANFYRSRISLFFEQEQAITSTLKQPRSTGLYLVN